MKNKQTALPLGVTASLIGLAVVFPESAHASAAGGGLPWENPLLTLTRSLTGPVAYGVSILAVIASGAALVWGAEINDFTRKILMLTLVIGMIVFAANFLSTLFNANAAGII